MPASAARIAANQQNALKSSGPKTPEGKERSRRNSLKHGLTGAGVVLPEADAAEVERKAAVYAQELNASDEISRDLARRAALNAVRMDRLADQQTAALSAHVREVEAEFVAPEGVEGEEADRLRSEAVRIAMFDASKEATLARRYESAAERAFFRCLKELRELQKVERAASKAEVTGQAQEMVGSILQQMQDNRKMDEQMDAWLDEMEKSLPPEAPKPVRAADFRSMSGGIDLPIAVGRPR